MLPSFEVRYIGDWLQLPDWNWTVFRITSLMRTRKSRFLPLSLQLRTLTISVAFAV